ncbi:MAG TPA: hypothetical protein VMT86_06545 [Bryobacteraceae bacterium]|nr:hypothetical protein [Bryobacteraceae bacterium]
MQLLLLAAVLSTSTLLAVDQGLLSLAPPDAQILAGINLEHAKAAPLGRFIQAQSQQKQELELSAMEKTMGFDPWRDVREVLVAAGPPDPGAFLVLLRGTFGVPRIVEAALANGGAAETYNGAIVVQRRTDKTALAFPGQTLAIIGPPATVRAAIDRKAGPAVISPALLEQVNQLSATQDAWFVSAAPLAGLDMQSPFAGLTKMQRSSGGLKSGAELVISLRGWFATAQDASALAAQLKVLLISADLYVRDSYRPASGLLRNLNVSAEGLVVNLSVSAPESQIEQLLSSSPRSFTPLLP